MTNRRSFLDTAAPAVAWAAVWLRAHLLTVAGLALIVAAAWQWTPTAGLAAAGVAVLAFDFHQRATIDTETGGGVP